MHDIKLVAAPVTLALVEEKNCRLHGKVASQKPIDIEKPRLVIDGGWQLSVTSKSCRQPDGTAHVRPFSGGAGLPSALKAGDRVAVIGSGDQ